MKRSVYAGKTYENVMGGKSKFALAVYGLDKDTNTLHCYIKTGDFYKLYSRGSSGLRLSANHCKSPASTFKKDVFFQRKWQRS